MAALKGKALDFLARRERTSAFLLYIIVVSFVYAPVVFAGKTLVPGLYYPHGLMENAPYGYEGRIPLSTFSIDLATPAYYESPVNRLVGDMLRRGELPLWNPHQAAGTPLLAQYSTRALFPYQMLEDVSPWWTWDFFMLTRLVIAGFFTFVFLRSIGLGLDSSFLGGVFYMLSGSFVWFINLEQMTNVAMLAPMLLICMERLSRSGAWRDVGLSAIVFGLVLFAGQPEVALYVLFLAGLYFIYRAGFDLKRFSRLAVGFALGLLMAAPLIFPFMELWAASLHIHPAGGDMGIRDTNPVSRAVNLFVPTFRELPSLPEFSHHPLVRTLDGFGMEHYTRIFPSNGEWDYLGGYSGVTALFLALSGVLVAAFRGRTAYSGQLVFFSAFAVAVLLKNFGFAPFLWLGYLPFFDQVWSQRWAGPSWTFAMAVSGALGLEMLKGNYQKEKIVRLPVVGRVRGYLAERKAFVMGLAAHVMLFKLSLLSAPIVLDLVLEYARGHGLSVYEGFVIRSFHLPAMGIFTAVYALVLAREGAASMRLSARGYAYAALAGAVLLNSMVFVLSASGVLDMDRDVYIGRAAYMALNGSFLILFSYVWAWRFVQRMDRRFERPHVVLFISAAALVSVFLVSRLAVAQSSFFAAPGIRPFYLPSIVMGQGVMAFTLAVAVALSAYYLRKGRGLYGILFLAVLELWFWVPRGYGPEWLLLKSASFAMGAVAIFFAARGRMGRACFSALLFLAAFLVLDSTSKYGFPERRDPFARPPYMDFLQGQGGDFRVMGVAGVLFPNYASTAGLNDVHFINSLVARDYQDFRLMRLHSRPVSTETSSTLWFTGRPELHTVDEAAGIGVEDVLPEADFEAGLRYYSLLGVRYILAPASYEIKGLPLVYDREIRIYENREALPRAFVTSPVEDVPSLRDVSPADIVESGANRVEVRAKGGGMLVLSDLWYPGWKARVDGKEASIHKVYGLLRGVDLPEGGHSVVFEYRPASFYLGSLCFLVGGFISLGMALVGGRSKYLDLSVESG